MNFTDDELNEIIDKYGNSVYRLAFSITKNQTDAEDVTQDVFVKFIENRHKIENDDHLKAWLIRVTINHCKNLFSEYWNKNTTALDNVGNSIHKNESSNLDEIIKREEYDELNAAVNALPAKYRAVIHLYYYEEYTVKLISETLNLSSGTVKWQLSRARQLLKKNLIGGNYVI